MKSIKFYKWLINGLVLFMLFSVNAFGAIQGLRGYYYKSGFGNLNLDAAQAVNIDPESTASFIADQARRLNRYSSYWPNKKDDTYNSKYYYIDKNIDFGWGYCGPGGVDGSPGALTASDTINPIGAPYQIATTQCTYSGNSGQTRNWSAEWKGYINIPETSNIKLYYSYNGAYYLNVDEQQLSGSGAPASFHHWAQVNLLNLPNNFSIFSKGYKKIHLKYSPTSGDNNFFRLGYNVNETGDENIKAIPSDWFVTEIPTKVFFYDPNTKERATSFSAIEADGKMDVYIGIDKKPSCAEDVKVDFNITLLPAAIDHANASDLNTSSRQITFACTDDLVKNIEIPVTKDRIAETTESFKMSLSNPIVKETNRFTYKYVNDILTPDATGYILSDSNVTQVEFLQPTFYITEGKDREHPNILRIPIRLNTQTSFPVRVQVSFRDGSAHRGSDYGAQDLTPVVFSPGETVKFVEVEIKHDGVREPIENFYADLALSENANAELGNNKEATIYIIDNKELNTCYNHKIDSNGTNDAYTAGWRLIGTNESSQTTTFEMKPPIKKGCPAVGLGLAYSKCGPETDSPTLIKYPSFFTKAGGMDDKPYFTDHIEYDKFGNKTNAKSTKRLRLSEGAQYKKTGISYHAPLPAAGNYIELEFDYYSYGGCVIPWGKPWLPTGGGLYDYYSRTYPTYRSGDWWSHEGGPGNLKGDSNLGELDYRYGGDGAAMVLYDASVGDRPSLGGSSGSLGYAQRKSEGNSGFQRGWLAVGLDEFGDFTISRDGRQPGLKKGFIGPKAGTALAPTSAMFQSSVTLRGSWPDYRFLATSGQLKKRGSEKPISQWAEDWKITYDNPFRAATHYNNRTRLATDYNAGRFKLSIDNTDVDKTWIKLERNTGNGFKTIISDFNVQEPGFDQQPLPENLRIAFTSSTGGACNIREVGDIVLKASFCFPENLLNEYRVIEKRYETTSNSWNWKWNSPLRTKIENKNQTYCILAGQGPDNGTAAATVEKNVKLEFVRFIDTTEGSVAEKVVSQLDPHTIGINPGNINSDNTIRIPSASTDICFQTNNEVSTRKGFFLVYDRNKSRTTNSELEYQRSSDYYSIRPKEFRMSFYETGANDVKKIIYPKISYDYIFSAVNETNATSANYLQKINSPIPQNGKRIDFDLNLTGKSCVDSTQETAPNNILFNTGLTQRYPINVNDIKLYSAKGEDIFWSKIDWEDVEKYNAGKLTEDQRLKFVEKIEQYGYECDGISTNLSTVATQFSDKAGGFEECKIPLDQNISFLPHHFDTKISIKGGSSDEKFTYISNDENMSGKIKASVSAIAGDNISVLQNFDKNCYANDLNLSLTLYRDIRFDEKDSSVKNYQSTGTIDSRILFWDDSKELNTTKRLSSEQNNNALFKIYKKDFTQGKADAFMRFNFARDIHAADEPFYVTSRDFNITNLSSTENNITVPEVYKDDYYVRQPAVPTSITSSTLSKSIFFYAKASPKPLYSGVSIFKDNYYYQIYCDKCIDNTVRTRYGMDGYLDPLSTLKWYTNKTHDLATDGYTKSPIPTDPSSKVTAAATINDGIQELTFEGVCTSVSIVDATAQISPWLEYNKDLSATPSKTVKFQVEYKCADEENWAGQGGIVSDKEGVGSTLNTGKINQFKSKRMEW